MCHSRTRLRPQTTRRAAPPLKPPGPSLPGRGAESRSGLAHGSFWPGLDLPLSGSCLLFRVCCCCCYWRRRGDGVGWGPGQSCRRRHRCPDSLAFRVCLPPVPPPRPRLRPSPRPRPRPLGPHADRAVLPSLSPVKPSGLGALLLPAAANLCLSSRGSSEPNVSEGTSLSAPRPSKSLPCAD